MPRLIHRPFPPVQFAEDGVHAIKPCSRVVGKSGGCPGADGRGYRVLNRIFNRIEMPHPYIMGKDRDQPAVLVPEKMLYDRGGARDAPARIARRIRQRPAISLISMVAPGICMFGIACTTATASA
jgi:hypothetical protein